MLEIEVSGELFDEENELFITVKPTILHLEHSLLSISKWEQKFHKAFISDRRKTEEEMLYYIQHCMTITKNVPENVYKVLSEENYHMIENYMDDPMTATWFWDDNKKEKAHPTPSEVIYCKMFSFGIPMECEKWHINRLIALIRTFNVENRRGKKKMSKAEIMRRNAILNERRKKELGTQG